MNTATNTVTRSLRSIFLAFKAECKKLLARRQMIFFTIGISLVLAILTALLLNSYRFSAFASNIYSSEWSLDSTTWREKLLAYIEEITKDLGNSQNIGKQWMIDLRANYQWHLDNNIIPYASRSAAGLLLGSFFVFSIIIIITMIFASKIMADEYVNNTIISLYTVPTNRHKILTAKLLTMVVVSIIISLIFYLALIIAGGLVFGFGSLASPYLVIQNGVVVSTTPVLLRGLLVLLTYAVTLIFASVAAIMTSILTKSSTISIVVSVSLYFVGWFVLSPMFYSGASWLRFTPFINMDFATYFVDAAARYTYNMSIGFSIGILCAYMIIMLIISYLAISKQQLKA